MLGWPRTVMLRSAYGNVLIRGGGAVLGTTGAICYALWADGVVGFAS